MFDNIHKIIAPMIGFYFYTFIPESHSVAHRNAHITRSLGHFERLFGPGTRSGCPCLLSLFIPSWVPLPLASVKTQLLRWFFSLLFPLFLLAPWILLTFGRLPSQPLFTVSLEIAFLGRTIWKLNFRWTYFFYLSSVSSFLWTWCLWRIFLCQLFYRSAFWLEISMRTIKSD